MNSFVQNAYGNFLDVQKLLKRFSDMETKKQPWKTKWQKIQDMTYPNMRDYTSKTDVLKGTSTEKIGNHCSAITGKITKAISMLHSQITDPMVKWIGLEFRKGLTTLMDGQQVSFEDNPMVGRWLQDCESSLYDLFNDPKSNFYPSSFMFHRDWFTLGTACRHVSIRNDTGDIYFNCISLNDIYIDTGAYDQIEFVARKYSLTAEQAYALWGDAIGAEQMQLLTAGSGAGAQKKFEYIEMCFQTPKEARQNTPFAVAPYLSCIINKAGKNIISIQPEISFPYIVARFDIDPGDLYGKSLVWLSMPDIIVTNRVSRRNIQAIDYASLPPILTSDALSINVGQLTPGAIVQGLDSERRADFQPLNMGANLPISMQFYEQKLAELDDELMAGDIIPPDLRGNMTPTEVIERKIQWNNRLRPILIRLETEDLRFTLKRAMHLLERKGQLPQFPYNVLGLSMEQLPDPVEMINISFAGQMAKMRRLQDAQNIDMLAAKAMQYAQVDQSVLQLMKFRDIVREEADIYDVPKDLLKTDEELAAEAEAAQQAMEAEQEQVKEQEKLQRRMIEGQMQKEGISEIPEDIL